MAHEGAYRMADDARQLTDQWAVVTGSTRGIGRAIALEFAAAGANVIVHGRDAASAEEVCSAVRQQKREAIALVTDISASEARQNLVERAWSEHKVDVWVNNAGVD